MKTAFVCAFLSEGNGSEDVSASEYCQSTTAVQLGTAFQSFAIWLCLSSYFRVCCSYLKGELFPEVNGDEKQELSLWECTIQAGKARSLLWDTYRSELVRNNRFLLSVEASIKDQWQPSALGKLAPPIS